MPRIKDPIWNHFSCKIKGGNSGKWAVCKLCEKEMQGIPKRMEKHYELCSAQIDNTGNYTFFCFYFNIFSKVGLSYKCNIQDCQVLHIKC